GGGTLNFLGNGNTSSTEQVTGLTLNAGGSTIAVAAGGSQTTDLRIGAFTRNAGATLNLTGTGFGTTNKVTLEIAPTLTNGILPYATINAADFATHSGHGSSLAAFTGYATTLSGATSSTNVKLTDPGSFSLTGATNVNSLLIVGNTTPTVLNEAGN